MDRHEHQAPASPPPTPAPGAAAVYTCPMHPGIRRDRPGSCPRCGMALEPLTPGPGAADDAELRDLGRRFWATLPLTAAGTAAPAMAGP